MTEYLLEPPIEAYDPALYQGVPSPLPVARDLNAVDAALVRQYRTYGYLCFRGVLPADLVTAGRDELVAMAHAADPDCGAVFYEAVLRERLTGDTADAVAALDPDTRAGYVRKFASYVGQHPPLAALAAYGPLMGWVEALVGGAAQLFQDMALVKPPRGREKPWHQDHAYFNYPLETPIVGVWIPFHPVDAVNGCMFVVPGSHRDGPRPHYQRRDWQLCDRDMLGQAAHTLPMAPGDLLLFDGKLVHGTPTNSTDEMRWAVQFHYAPATAVAADDDTGRLAAFGGRDADC